jgi:hypothetical protein
MRASAAARVCSEKAGPSGMGNLDAERRSPLDRGRTHGKINRFWKDPRA